MLVPWQQIDPDVLSQLLEEIVTRDGTDYGYDEKTTTQKVQRALAELQSGRAKLSWDVDTGTGNLIRSDSLKGGADV